MEHTIDENIAFIKNPERWPAYPFLPVKHRTKTDGVFPLHATIVKFFKTRVYHINMYSIDGATKFAELPRTEYESVEALAQEWEVD